MDNEIVEKIMSWHQSGAKVMLRRSTTGKGRIKVVSGPLGLLTRRFEVNLETYEAVKRICIA